jgi:hypothetical protein
MIFVVGSNKLIFIALISNTFSFHLVEASVSQ